MSVDKFCWATVGRNDRATRFVRFVDFRFKIKCKCFRCGDDKVAGCRGQFFFRIEFVNPIQTLRGGGGV